MTSAYTQLAAPGEPHVSRLLSDLRTLEANFDELVDAGRPVLAWSWLACAVTRSLAEMQIAIIAQEREIMKHPRSEGAMKIMLDEIAARQGLIQKLFALRRALSDPSLRPRPLR